MYRVTMWKHSVKGGLLVETKPVESYRLNLKHLLGFYSGFGEKILETQAGLKCRTWNTAEFGDMSLFYCNREEKWEE